MIFFDTETCGLVGPLVTIQWGREGEPIRLHHAWLEPAGKTMELIEQLCEEGVVDFNGVFDWYQINKFYNMLSYLDPDDYPDEHIDRLAMIEPKARFGKCLKPRYCLDLMLHARKGPYQSTMDRDDVRIKRIPTALAEVLCEELNKRIQFKDIYFARSKDKRRWHVKDIIDEEAGEMEPDFKDILLQFNPTSALKALICDALGKEDVLHFEDVEVPEKLRPVEIPYAPFALAVVKESRWRALEAKSGKLMSDVDFDMDKVPTDWKGSWPQVIKHHIWHWRGSELAQKYAKDDVQYLIDLYNFFGRPECNDDDSILAHMIGAIRWNGYAVNVPYFKQKKEQVIKLLEEGARFGSSDFCRKYLEESLGEHEKMVLRNENGKVTTGKFVLEQLVKWKIETICECSGLDANCKQCHGKGSIPTEEVHPAAIKAKTIQDYRKAKAMSVIYDKIILAGRFHVSLDVIGALSGRMAGQDGLNAQGIDHSKEMRKGFTLADPDQDLNGGDLDSAEVSIAEAVYNDPQLRKDLLSGKKFHALLGEFLFPPLKHDDIKATGKLSGDANLYSRAKQGTFAMLYGGDENTLATRVGIPVENGRLAYINFTNKYKQVAEARKRIFDKFCSMRQPNGIGSKVEWHDPADYIETMFGFRRYYTLENRICKELFHLAENPPKQWLAINFKVKRRDREQMACNALRSALFAAAFAIQAANMRSAANHEIQGTCSQVTKKGQVALWTLQPAGVWEWIVKPLNIHDEINTPTAKEYTEQTCTIIEAWIESIKPTIPLIAMDWKTKMADWSEK